MRKGQPRRLGLPRLKELAHPTPKVRRHVDTSASSMPRTKAPSFRWARNHSYVVAMPSSRVIDGVQPKFSKPRHIKDLARSSIRLCRVKREFRLRIYNVAHLLRELANAEIRATPDVEVAIIAVSLHDKQAGVRKIIDVEELTP